MDERGDAPALALDDRRHTLGAVRGKLDRPTFQVDVPSLLREPVGELERRIVERPGERAAELAGGAALAELDDEVGDRAAREPAAKEPELEGERHDRVGDEERQVDRAGYVADRSRPGG